MIVQMLKMPLQLYVAVYFLAVNYGEFADCLTDSIEKRLISLEEKLVQQEDEIRHQQYTIQKQDNRIQQLEKLCLETEIKKQHAFIQTNLEPTVSKDNVTAAKKSRHSDHRKTFALDSLKNLHLKDHVPGLKTVPRDIQQGERVAFTVYASNAIEHLGIGQPIKFDTILTNIGDSYNVVTGVFTVPVGGLYAFSFHIAEYRVHEINVALSVDGKETVHAIADAITNDHDVQGGNFALLSLSAGQSVWVESKYADGYMWAAADQRFSTFSGFLVYMY